LHLALDVRFARGMAWDRGVDHEAAVFGVLGERASEDGVVAVGLRDRRLKTPTRPPGPR
jgi:hypothetical protein